jgi:hypothetical protein
MIGEGFDPNLGLTYGAGAAGALGAAGMIWSAVLLAVGPDQVCIAAEDRACRYVRLPRSGYGKGGTSAAGIPINTGAPVFQIGAGLFTAGVAWLTGALVLDREWWWLTLASGVALGSITGGLLFLAD